MTFGGALIWAIYATSGALVVTFGAAASYKLRGRPIAQSRLGRFVSAAVLTSVFAFIMTVTVFMFGVIAGGGTPLWR